MHRVTHVSADVQAQPQDLRLLFRKRNNTQASDGLVGVLNSRYFAARTIGSGLAGALGTRKRDDRERVTFSPMAAITVALAAGAAPHLRRLGVVPNASIAGRKLAAVTLSKAAQLAHTISDESAAVASSSDDD